MRLLTIATLLLASCRSFATCRPCAPEQSENIDNCARAEDQGTEVKLGPGAAVDVSDLVEVVQDVFRRGSFNLNDSLKKGAQIVDDLVLQSNHLKPGEQPPIAESVQELRARIKGGDLDLNKAAKDGIAYVRRATTDADLNSLASSGLALLRKKADEYDLNDAVVGWLNQANTPKNEGLGTRLRRNLLTSAASSLFNVNNFQGLIKLGVNAVIKLARNIDFNALANQGLNLLSSTISNTDLNKIADKGTRSLDGLEESVDLNHITAKGLELLLS